MLSPVPCSAFGLRASCPSQTSVLASLRAAVGGARRGDGGVWGFWGTRS